MPARPPFLRTIIFGVRVPGYWALPLAVQLAIVINDVAFAFLEVVQFRVTCAAVSRLAVCFQVITINTNSIAGLRIRPCRKASLRISVRITRAPNSAVAGCNALQIAVFIHDLPTALPVIVKLGVMPIAVYGLATCFKIVAMALDVFTGLRVRAAETADRSVISALISASVSAGRAISARNAAELAIVIHNFAATLVVVVQLGIFPFTV